MTFWPNTGSSIIAGVVVLIITGTVAYFRKKIWSHWTTFKKKVENRFLLSKYAFKIIGVPRIFLNDQAGIKEISIDVEFKNFENFPITLYSVKCPISLGSHTFTELKDTEVRKVPPMSGVVVSLKKDLTPDLAQKALDIYGNDNGYRSKITFDLRYETKGPPRSIWPEEETMIELVVFGRPKQVVGNNGKPSSDFLKRFKNNVNRIERSRRETEDVIDDKNESLEEKIRTIKEKLSAMGKLIEPINDELKNP